MSAPVIYAPSDAFGQFRVKELSESDFALRSETPTALMSSDMTVILFYEPNGIDPQILGLWDEIARRIGGATIAAVNMSSRREVMKAFFDVQADFDNPFNAYTGFISPSIIVYRKRWPQAFYNGELSEDAVVAWISQLAWKPGYRELDAYQTSELQGPGPSTYFGTGNVLDGDDGEEGEEGDEEESLEPEDFYEEPQKDSEGRLLRREPMPIADPGFL